MKRITLAIALTILPCIAHAGTYITAGGLFDSVAFNQPFNGVVPGGLNGYQAEAGYTYRRLGMGVEYSTLNGSSAGNSLAMDRWGVNLNYHVRVFPRIDTFIQGGAGQASYHADISTFAHGVTTTSRLFGGSETDWNVGLGAIVPVYGPLKVRLLGRYQPTDFGGRANSSIVFGIGIALTRDR